MGVLASKYNVGINSWRLMTSPVFAGTLSKRQSEQSCILVPEEVLGCEGHVPRFGGRSFG